MVFLEEGKRSSTLEALLELICDPRTPVIMCRNLLITLNSYQNSVSSFVFVFMWINVDNESEAGTLHPYYISLVY